MSYFEQVIGQKATIDHLTTLVERGTLPHSLLFYGEKGLGKLNTAIGLASLLIGRQVFSADGGAQFLEAVANARQADGESEKKRKRKAFLFTLMAVRLLVTADEEYAEGRAVV